MNAHDYILYKQIQWAHRNNIMLIGSKGNRGYKAYTQNLNDNLFEPLLPEVKGNFEEADGGELTGNPCKMQAVHSSSALGVNIFQYWKRINQIPVIAAACEFYNRNNNTSQDINFEVKFSINDKFRFSPNIDVVITNSPKSRFKVFVIECKFSEAYSSQKHSGIDPKYIELDTIWEDIPNLYQFAKTISPDDGQFTYLHPAQLIKHILGLKEKFGKNKFRLLYLWYDTIGPESATHHREINEFIKITKADGVYFHAMSYQELIIKLSEEYRGAHKDYINYVSGRYL
ncbi:hypothetical protein A2V47_02800 [Candidatus Atribacteria bacterium RBG_19FT_COMBO_35_14]|uniref:Restriction endonuclease n=1 Tax=Candidatus Sediminicultor quintus TaxID=1797291 RepID=A0A1F5AEM6_9BACT|nr:MAG: hypothetical protein A2V47_02800 [Candidatus Atribacteria bacterium RBG_19FT_COMBO_35_14]